MVVVPLAGCSALNTSIASAARWSLVTMMELGSRTIAMKKPRPDKRQPREARPARHLTRACADSSGLRKQRYPRRGHYGLNKGAAS
jgi:hypothetical protein